MTELSESAGWGSGPAASVTSGGGRFRRGTSTAVPIAWGSSGVGTLTSVSMQQHVAQVARRPKAAMYGCGRLQQHSVRAGPKGRPVLASAAAAWMPGLSCKASGELQVADRRRAGCTVQEEEVAAPEESTSTGVAAGACYGLRRRSRCGWCGRRGGRSVRRWRPSASGYPAACSPVADTVA